MKTLAITAAMVGALVATGAQAQTATGSYNGHTYSYYSGATDFATANANAAALGGYLATVTSQGEQDFIHTSLTASTAWIGGTDEGTEGLWRWIGGPEAGQTFYSTTGAPVDIPYSFWNSGEPNNSGGENALQINWASDGRWNDYPGGGSYGYVVEFGGLDAGVPEPATWAMMIAGFGLVGGALRRRRATAALA